MATGTQPITVYLASTASTRMNCGIAGYGIPSSSTMSISADKSLPLIVSVVRPAPGVLSWWWVITPSASTEVWPRMVTAMTTRTTGIELPPVSRNRVFSGEPRSRLKVSSKPLWVSPDPASTVTVSSAARTSAPTGTATPGPIMSVIRTGLVSASAMADPGGSGSHRQAQPTPDHRGQLGRIGATVRVGDQPPELGVAERGVGDEI